MARKHKKSGGTHHARKAKSKPERVHRLPAVGLIWDDYIRIYG